MAIPARYQPAIQTACLSAGAIGVPGAFSAGLDISAMAGIWSTMMVAIAMESGHKIDTVFAGKVAAAVAAGVGDT